MTAANRRRCRRAIERGFTAIGRRLPELVDPPAPRDRSILFGGDSPAEYRRRVELEQRAELQALELGRDLVKRGVMLEQQAEVAKRAGVEVLRLTARQEPWSAIAELLGMASAQGAHKRYRDVEGPEAELTIDDELERGSHDAHT